MSRLTTGGTPLEQPLRRSIAGRLVFWFLVIALIPCAILTAITARIASTALEGSVRTNLVQIAASKAGEIESYAAERVRDGMALARGPTFVRGLRSLAAVPSTEAGRERQQLTAAAAEFVVLPDDAAGRVPVTEISARVGSWDEVTTALQADRTRIAALEARLAALEAA